MTFRLETAPEHQITTSMMSVKLFMSTAGHYERVEKEHECRRLCNLTPTKDRSDPNSTN